jgi:hypothetical protein
MRQHERAAQYDSAGGRGSQGAREERRLFHEQCVRAVGVAIVLHGSMHPAMELLLRHAIQYLGEPHTR